MISSVGAATLIVPYYRNPLMLETQLRAWREYPAGLQIILVDDGSPEPAIDVVSAGIAARPDLRERVSVYRIGVDIPWNRGGARNLGAHLATTEWIVQVDIDHVLPAECAAALLGVAADSARWYRFERFRRGRADETRRKDDIPDDQEFGQVHPHVDSYLCTRALYWRVGGYDEDYSGCLGGGSPFLRQMTKAAGAPLMLPLYLHVYTRTEVPDASDTTLSRSSGEYSRRRRRKEARRDVRPRNPLRFPWKRVL